MNSASLSNGLRLYITHTNTSLRINNKQQKLKKLFFTKLKQQRDREYRNNPMEIPLAIGEPKQRIEDRKALLQR